LLHTSLTGEHAEKTQEMKGVEDPSLAGSGRGFSAEVAAVLLLSFTVIEFASLIGLSRGVTSTLPHPVDKVLGSSFSVMGLLGAYYMLRKGNWGAYLAILTSAFELVLGGFSLLKAYVMMDLGISQVSASLAAILLGSLTLLCVFKTPLNGGGNPGKESLKPASSGSESRYAVETINVTKRYSLGPHVVLAINGINLKVRKGEFVAIMGPSGSGKSTLLNLIGALDRPSSGKVLIDGVDISKLDEGELAKLRNEKIGFIFQAYNLISRSTVLRNMELPALVKGYSREERLRRIRELLAVVGLEDKIMRKPKTLSGGEQQRVAIARALMNDPQIVLADEPTGNVDSKTGKVIMKFLRKLNLEKGTTVIVVTHDPEVARMADRILYLRDGRIVKEEVVGGASAWKEELKAVSS